MKDRVRHGERNKTPGETSNASYNFSPPHQSMPSLSTIAQQLVAPSKLSPVNVLGMTFFMMEYSFPAMFPPSFSVHLLTGRA